MMRHLLTYAEVLLSRNAAGLRVSVGAAPAPKACCSTAARAQARIVWVCMGRVGVVKCFVFIHVRRASRHKLQVLACIQSVSL